MSEFDRFSKNYTNVLDRVLSFSGEDSGYFADYKARYARGCVSRHFNGKILDFGCGIGLVSKYLKHYFPSSELHGYDSSADSIALLGSAETTQSAFFTSDSSQLDHDYDLIVVSNVMHHIPPTSRQTTILDLRERLAPGGRILVFEHNPANPFTRWVVHHCAFDKEAVLLWPKELAACLGNAGLRIERKAYMVFFPRFLARLRPFEPIISWCPLGSQYAMVGERNG